jgi:hypothetical protein
LANKLFDFSNWFYSPKLTFKPTAPRLLPLSATVVALVSQHHVVL